MESANPFEAPRSDLGKFGPADRKSLGSLAQSARGNEIKKARIALIVAGLILVAQNIFLYLNTENEIRDALQQQVQQQGPNFVVDQNSYDQVMKQGIQFGHILYGGAGACGVVLIVLGASLTVAPVVFSILGLLIYLGVIAVFGYLNPVTIVAFWLIKLIMIICLVKAIQASLAYRKDTEIVEEMGGSIA